MDMEDKYQALVDCVRQTIATINDCLPKLTGIHAVKLRLWRDNLYGHLPEALEDKKRD